jgi:hypothetical protein
VTMLHMQKFCWSQYIQEQDTQCTYKVTMRPVRVTIVEVEKQQVFNINLCVCILALFIWHAKRMRHIILSSVDCPAVPYSSTLHQNRRDFWTIFTEHKMRVFIFSATLSETFLILRRIRRDIINVPRSSCKLRVILVIFE